MTAVIDKGKEVETIGGIEAHLLRNIDGNIELYQSQTKRKVIDTFENKVILKDGPNIAMVFHAGKRIV